MFSKSVSDNLKRASGIRAMFEEGEKLKKAFGAENVFDFTLGNPDPEPPAEIKRTLLSLLNSGQSGLHRYMANAGFLDIREKIAEQISIESGIEMPVSNVVMTCGAAGGLNVVLKSILNPGEEVLSFAPCFPEYAFYTDNHGGIFKMVPFDGGSFQPKPEALRALINPLTKAIILNSPNNPTGAVYKAANLFGIKKVIEEKQNEYGTTIYVISDEPYTRLVYDGVKVPDIFLIFDNSIKVNSYSKSLSLPGERIGYVAVNPLIKDCGALMDAIIFCNRVLGYVNAPALFQRVIAKNLNVCVDCGIYKEKRDMLYDGIIAAGFECEKPDGAFYLFPKSPIADDVEFKNIALEHKLLVVPGKSFGAPGYLRLSYCVSMDTIINSLPVFAKLGLQLRSVK